MEKLSLNDLYVGDDIHTGENIFYLDEALTMPYSGVIVDYFRGKLSWECDIKDGYRDGIEKIYYDNTGELMSINEVSKNTLNGVSTEYFKTGKIMHKRILLRNMDIASISYDEYGNIIERYAICKKNPPIGYYLDWDKIEEYKKRYTLE